MNFEVNQAGQLHLRATGSDTSVLFTAAGEFPETEWRFWMKLSFNTSSNNFARVYLASDTHDLNHAVNGWFLQAGGAGDSLYLIKQTGLVQEKAYNFHLYRTNHSTNTLRCKISRDPAGNWEFMIDTTGGFNYLRDGGFTDNSVFPARWFGFYCRYTSSNAAKFYFDDVYTGPVVHDTTPPAVLSQEVISESEIRIGFSETVERKSAENRENYQLGPTGRNPDSIAMDLQQPVVSLFFHEPLPEGVFYGLNIRDVADNTGNRIRDTVVTVCWYRAKAFDIVINEIMADPDPPVGLPAGEYVELYNKTNFPVNLRDWHFSYSSSTKVFPPAVIAPGGYLLIVKDSVWMAYASCVFLFTSSSSLSNEGTQLVLRDRWNRVIHAVSYSPAWYQGSFKGEGGWSLEMEDPLNPCGCGENWVPSLDISGGTPGRANSTRKSNADAESPFPIRAMISDSLTVELFFSEKMDSTTMLSPSDWEISSGEGSAPPVRITPVAPDFISARLSCTGAFARGVTYRLKISGEIKDCAGNPCDTGRSVRFAIADTVAEHDIVINEILSNPASGGARFVELFNRSSRIIDLQNLVLANRDTAAGLISGAAPLFASGFILFPGDYLALTSDPADICGRYHPAAPGNVLLMQQFPVFGDDTGTVILARKDNSGIIDRMKYDAGMHYPLLATMEGVSLERTCADMSSDDRNNWHSAAETAWFATPGYINSHSVASSEGDREVTIEPAVFSPDNDGYQDLLAVIIHEKDPDCTVNIRIYDSRGRLVCLLVNNVLTGSEGVFSWDGMTSGRAKAPIGFYVLLIEITNPGGTVKRYKKTAVLAGRL